MAELLKEYSGTWEEILTHSDELAGQQVSVHVAQPIHPPKESKLTLEETAAIMEASLHYVTKLVESGDLPSYIIDGERLVRRGDIAIFREARKRKSRAALDEIAAIAQELKLP